MRDLVENPTIDPTRMFEKCFMQANAFSCKRIVGQTSPTGYFEPKPQMHLQVRHIFRLAKPYNEKTRNWNERANVVTADPEKNNTVINYLKFNIGSSIRTGKTCIIFVERKTDVETLFKLLYHREEEYNPNFGESKFQNRQDKFTKIGPHVTVLKNSPDSIIAKISSLNNQLERETALNNIRRKTKLVLITTNVCSRALDLPNVDMVINYMLPEWHDKKAFKGIGRADGDYVYRY